MRQITVPPRSRSIYAMGLLVGISSFVVLYFAHYFDGLPLRARILVYCLILFAGFFAGIGLYGIYTGTRAIWDLGCFPIHVTRHKFGVISTGTLLLKCYLATALAWTFFFMSAIVGNPYSVLPLTIGSPVIIIGLPTIAAILGSFVICQVPLHHRMVEYKRKELIEIDRILSQLAARLSNNFDNKICENIDFLERRKDQIMALPEWPFDIKSLMGATASSVMPLVVNATFSLIAKSEFVKTTLNL